MALLTAEDVLNKAFSKTKYREGFDQDEVDDFLDEVANTIAQLTAERDEFAARVANGGAAAAVEAPPATAAGGVPGTTGLLAAATEPGGVNPTGMLAMAQKLHDEYVQAGEAERDRIIADANVAADDVRERADGDAKARMDALEGERSELEARIDDLRRFERDYRARLKAYLENLLGDLDHTGAAGAGAGFAAAGLAELTDDSGKDQPVADDADADHEAPAADEAPAMEAPGEFTPAVADAWGESGTFGSGEYGDDGAVVIEDVVVADVYESEDGETEVVVVEEYETVSYEQALGGHSEAEAEAEPVGDAPHEEQHVEQPSAPPSYDATQPWETQLRPAGEGGFANPFAPVTEAVAAEPAAAPEAGDVPAVDAPADSDEAPYTPPSSRMFTDLYGQQRPEPGN